MDFAVEARHTHEEETKQLGIQVGKIYAAWKEARVGIKAAIIGAIAVILAALIPTVLPYLIKSSKLIIITVVGGQKDKRPTVDIVVENKADTPQIITATEVDLSQDNSLNTLGSSTYVITNAEAEAQSGSIRGKIQEATKQPVSLPISGYLKLHDRGAWELDLTAPIQEEIPPSGGRQILIVFPETISLAKGEKLPFLWQGLANQTNSGDPPDSFNLPRFLKERGEMLAIVKVTYMDGKTTSYRTSLAFAD